MRLFIFLFLLVFCFMSMQLSAQHFISVQGKTIVGPDDKPFLIRGTNLGNWLLPEGYMFKFKSANSTRLIDLAFRELLGPSETDAFWTKFQQSYIREADVKYLKYTGINTIRVPFSYQLFTNQPYMGSSDSERGFRLIDSLVNWSRKYGLYLILDMHAAPGGQTGDNIDNGYGYPFLYESPENRNETLLIWKKIAAHYKNEPVIMGYDLLNEPIAHYFPVLNPFLEPLYKEITTAIREVDKNHLVFLGGAQWDGNFNVFGKPFDSKAVYTFHKYWMPVELKAIQQYIDFRDKYNVPIYIGETGENKDPWIHEFKVLLEKNNIGWNYWCYKKMDNLSGFLSFQAPAGFDSIIAYTEKNRSSFAQIRTSRPSDVNKARAAILDILRLCRFENCSVNTGYLTALNLKSDKPVENAIENAVGLIKPGIQPLKLSSQFSFTEGPAVDSKGNIFFTDQPDDKIWEYTATGKLVLFMEHAGRANGMHTDHHDNLIVCADEHNQIVKISPSKKVTVMVTDYQHHVLNGPNDVWVNKKGDLYITDPYYKREYWTGTHPDLPTEGVYYLKAGTKELRMAADDLVKPNGIVGTPDGKYLYVSDIQANKTYKFKITTDGSLTDKALLFEQGSDGMTLDNKGNIYITGQGVTIYNPDGKKVGHISIPENWTANVCFGGKEKNKLFITASKSIYLIPMEVHGIE